MRRAMLLAALVAFAWAARAEDEVKAVKLEPELPTLHCLGYLWFISGDDNRNATAAVSYRKAGEDGWRKAMPLRRVEVAAMENRKPPGGQGLFAGSIFFLASDTEYEVKLELSDPDGGGTTETVRQRTWKEPVAPKPLRVVHVFPRTGGGGDGNAVKGLETANRTARPGDLLLLHKGVYKPSKTLHVSASGTAQAPIVWRGAGDGEAIIESPGQMKGILFGLYSKQHVYFEKLTFRGFRYAFHANGSGNIVVRRCHFDKVGTGYVGDNGKQRRIFIADNLIEGAEPWPKPKGYRSPGEVRGVELAGMGHVVCYNRVRRFRDAIDVRPGYPVRAIDIHNNDISESTDDAIELDFSEHNTRAFYNRITNVPQGITFQPCRGGPAYAVRNVLYNVAHETWKLHLTPINKGANWATGPHRTSGGVMIHNTVVKSTPPIRVWSQEGPANYFYMRNNLYVGTGRNAIETTPPLNHLDSDHNIYANGEGKAFSPFVWMFRKTYATPKDFAAKTGCEGNSLSLAGFAGIFAGEVSVPDKGKRYDPPDLRLAAGSRAIDRGQVLPGLSDGFTGQAPDIGAYEFGAEPPHYGVRPEGKEAEIDGRIGRGARAPAATGKKPDESAPAENANGNAAEEAKARRLLKAARQFERAGQKGLAATLYERIVKECPNSALVEDAKKRIARLRGD